ncbi:MAG: hypothetical protein QOK26_1972, partial [Pseudonocardiales bacterium]|nr:hypothetical protein [Pseudonocardiales bacterium]
MSSSEEGGSGRAALRRIVPERPAPTAGTEFHASDLGVELASGE